MTAREKSLVALTLDKLVGAIMSHEYDGGVPPQDDLALQLGVSRGVIREALSMLRVPHPKADVTMAATPAETG